MASTRSSSLALPHLTQTYPEIERVIREAASNPGAAGGSYPSSGEAQVNGAVTGRELAGREAEHKVAFDAVEGRARRR